MKHLIIASSVSIASSQLKTRAPNSCCTIFPKRMQRKYVSSCCTAAPATWTQTKKRKFHLRNGAADCTLHMHNRYILLFGGGWRRVEALERQATGADEQRRDGKPPPRERFRYGTVFTDTVHESKRVLHNQTRTDLHRRHPHQTRRRRRCTLFGHFPIAFPAVNDVVVVAQVKHRAHLPLWCRPETHCPPSASR